jgi:hypothetical protein
VSTYKVQLGAPFKITHSLWFKHSLTMSRNNTLQNAILLLGVTFDEALAAEIAKLNIEGRRMVLPCIIVLNILFHRRGRGYEAYYTS